MTNPSPALPAPDDAVLFRPVADGAVLLHADDEVYFGLNEVGARIWALLPPEAATVDELVRRLAESYPDVADATLRADVTSLLAELREAGLVADRD